MNNEKKLSIITHSIALVIVITIMTILCFKNTSGEYIDLAINHALSNSRSFFGIFFMCVGEYPAYFLIPIGGVIFYYNNDRFEKDVHKLLWKIFSCVLIFIGIFIFANNCTKIYEIESYVMIGFAIFFGLFLGAIALGIGAFIPKEEYHKLFKFAVFIIAFTLIALVLMQVLKACWSRMRYRDMLKEGNFEGFTPWFLPQMGRANPNPDYDYTSFPSGHTSSACHIFVICLLPHYFKKLDTKKWKVALYIISIVFTVLVAISRIVNNAHYLSDVVMGGSLTYAVFYLLKYAFFKNGKYEFNKLEENESAAS